MKRLACACLLLIPVGCCARSPRPATPFVPPSTQSAISPERTTADDKPVTADEMKAAILRMAPIGTPMDEVRQRMLNDGFTCTWVSEVNASGNGEHDTLYCQRAAGLPATQPSAGAEPPKPTALSASVSWGVTFIPGSDNTVKEVWVDPPLTVGH